MRIAFITGSYPPDTCGVGDYTYRLALALQACGVTIDIVSHEKWTLGNSLNIVRRVKDCRPDIVHVQYPTIGFGYGLAPQAVSLLCRCVVTLHEVSQAHIVRKLSLYPFTVRSPQVIFTTYYEQRYLLQLAPWLKKRSSVIPIGSNITAGNFKPEHGSKEVVYFGLIRPNRGLEDVLQLAALIKEKRKPLSVRIVGKTHPDGLAYYNKLRLQTKSLPVQWSEGLTETETADVLSRAEIAYALLALLANGIAVVTTSGAQTTPALEDVALFAQNPDEALSIVEKLFSDNGQRMSYREKGVAYAANFAWSSIAKRHLDLYHRLVSTGKSQ
jgi:glycosyltransferase involved in cell wall biosynthesis